MECGWCTSFHKNVCKMLSKVDWIVLISKQHNTFNGVIILEFIIKKKLLRYFFHLCTSYHKTIINNNIYNINIIIYFKKHGNNFFLTLYHHNINKYYKYGKEFYIISYLAASFVYLSKKRICL